MKIKQIILLLDGYHKIDGALLKPLKPDTSKSSEELLLPSIDINRRLESDQSGRPNVSHGSWNLFIGDVINVFQLALGMSNRESTIP